MFVSLFVSKGIDFKCLTCNKGIVDGVPIVKNFFCKFCRVIAFTPRGIWDDGSIQMLKGLEQKKEEVSFPIFTCEIHDDDDVIESKKCPLEEFKASF